MTHSFPTSWHSLPVEMKLAVVSQLTAEDIKALSKVDQRTYALCVPATFEDVTLASYDLLKCFLEYVPKSYMPYIKKLDICTQVDKISLPAGPCPVTDALITLLNTCPRLERLSLKLATSLDRSIIPSFSGLRYLKQLAISNCAEEERAPLSERLIVAIAASLPSLQELSLDRISRSTMHAPELVGVYPYVPLVTNDDNIPDDPVLGADLALPSLLRIPTLRKLVIRDTHLGDPTWATTPVACHLEVLDLGSCVHETDAANRVCTERIMRAVGPSVDEFALATSVSAPVFAAPAATPLRRLRRLHITPFFPPERVADSLATLAGSPIETLSLQCFADDVVDVCAGLEDFLGMRVERGGAFYDRLRRIDVSVTAAPGAGAEDAEDVAERQEAARRLQEFCAELNLASDVDAGPCTSECGAERGDVGKRDGDDDVQDGVERQEAARRLQELSAELDLASHMDGCLCAAECADRSVGKGKLSEKGAAAGAKSSRH